jgi:hypothetical protein
MQNAPRFGRVMTQGYCVTVVDVPDRHAYDVGLELRRRSSRRDNRVGGEAQIEKSDPVSRAIERRGNASETVGHHRIRLSLAIGAHEQDARSATFGSFSDVHISQYTACAGVSR